LDILRTRQTYDLNSLTWVAVSPAPAVP